MAMASELPSIYSFPPLYTRQPNSLIRAQQLDAWLGVLKDYARGGRVWIMGRDGSAREPKGEGSVFVNEQLQRRVPGPFVDEIWAHAVANGAALRHSADSFYVLWRSLDSWSALLLQWFETCGRLNEVVTIYELVAGDEASSWEFHGMHEGLCELALGKLVERGRATLISSDGSVVAVKVI
ncbi:AaceriAGL318Wp [[Ashbya] aceris (nom. inval.)]|nr:AaceriAGL318Wp [[Ashbya] aceris (nom. inval.)]